MPRERSYSYTCRKNVWTKARYSCFCDERRPPRKRRVTVKTIHKWVIECDRKMDTSVWLRYDKVNHEYVATLKCCVSAELNEKLRGMRNYNPAFAVGSGFCECPATKITLLPTCTSELCFCSRSRAPLMLQYAPIAKAYSNHLFMSEHDWYLSDQDQ